MSSFICDNLRDLRDIFWLSTTTHRVAAPLRCGTLPKGSLWEKIFSVSLCVIFLPTGFSTKFLSLAASEMFPPDFSMRLRRKFLSRSSIFPFALPFLSASLPFVSGTCSLRVPTASLISAGRESTVICPPRANIIACKMLYLIHYRDRKIRV